MKTGSPAFPNLLLTTASDAYGALTGPRSSMIFPSFFPFPSRRDTPGLTSLVSRTMSRPLFA